MIVYVTRPITLKIPAAPQPRSFALALRPHVTPSLYESIWTNVLGLPTGLNCPQTGGIFSPLCGGVSPTMDQAPVGEGSLNNICRQMCSASYNFCQVGAGVSKAWQRLLGYWPGDGVGSGIIQGTGGVDGVENKRTGHDVTDLGAAVSDACVRTRIDCIMKCQPPNATSGRTGPGDYPLGPF
jgi:hypothetical protein